MSDYIRMRTVHYRFKEIKVKATHRWIDADGKRRQKTQVFMQTVNPFNKDKRGRVKSEAQILNEVREAREKWLTMMKKEHP